MSDRFGPEISDLIVDYDPVTLERRDVAKQTVLERLRETRVPSRATRVAARLVEHDSFLDREAIDGILVRSHLELQRLHEEFQVGAAMRAMLAPMLAVIRASTTARPIRIVDLGCGLGFVLRWLAARGGLGDELELVGADYNRALIAGAQRLADDEGLACRFIAGNAFELREPAHIVISTGVLHHFRGEDLAAVFAQHERAGVLAFVHVDIRPSRVAPLGAWIFHQARMREPLAKFDGFWSAVRAHDGATLRRAIAAGAPAFATAMVDARPGLLGLLRIFQAALGVRSSLAPELRGAYAAFGRRLEVP
ncbi:MAG: class I SAM-dependent methyltransferase [Kofleriaceae bacterium]